MAPLRWTPGRKAEICRQIIAGELTAADAMARHQLGADELHGWLDGFRKRGIAGLSVTRRERAHG